MIRCRTCLIPDSRPDSHFDETGQCSACYNYARRPTINWESRKRDLLEILDRHNGRCLVPSSGGKDSLAQILMLQELGADVTAVTAETCHLTVIGAKNIENAARYATTIRIMPNKQVRAKLNRIGLELVGDISFPEHVAIHTVPFQVAVDTGISLLIYGEHSPTEYGGPPDIHENRKMTRRWAAEYAGYLGLRIGDIVGMDGLQAKDLRDYQCPSDSDLAGLGVEAYFLGQFLPWNSHENAARSIANGFVYELPSPANWWPWENQDSGHTGIHDHMMYLKYGYGRGCAQISVDVRNGLIDRAAALAWVEEHDGLFPQVYAGVPVEDVLDRIGMTRPELDAVMARFTSVGT